MKRSLISAVFVTLGLFAGSSAFAANADCEAKAAEKKLAGAAKTSFVKKCEKDAGGAAASGAAAMCDKSAAEKKLAGAAKTSHVKKCMADAKAGKPA
jgi:hypothetical protein